MTLGFDPHLHWGYPEEIDALAVRLSQLAAKIGNGSQAAHGAIEAMEFEGPKARELRQRARDRRRSAQEIAERLQELSRTAFSAADLSRQKLYELELAERKAREAMDPYP